MKGFLRRLTGGGAKPISRSIPQPMSLTTAVEGSISLPLAEVQRRLGEKLAGQSQIVWASPTELTRTQLSGTWEQTWKYAFSADGQDKTAVVFSSTVFGSTSDPEVPAPNSPEHLMKGLEGLAASIGAGVTDVKALSPAAKLLGGLAE